MIKVVYPKSEFKFKTDNGRECIFDPIRKTWLALTNEEWVRQNFIQYLVQEMKYPSSLIALEKEIWLGELKKRFDILVYDRSYNPWMMIECKAQSIELKEQVIEQLLRYNISVPVQYLIITNGHFTYGWKRTETGVEELNEMPPIK